MNMKKWKEISHPNDERMPLAKQNYILLLIGFAVRSEERRVGKECRG